MSKRSSKKNEIVGNYARCYKYDFLASLDTKKKKKPRKRKCLIDYRKVELAWRDASAAMLIDDSSARSNLMNE